MRIKLPSLHDFSRDTKLLIAVTGILAISFFGLYALLRVLYILRLGYGPEYVGIFSATGALTYMGMGIPSGALGVRLGTRKAMLIGGVIAVLGMTLLPLTEFAPLALRDFWPFFSQVVLTTGWSMLNVNLVPALMVSTTEWNRNMAYALSSAFRETGILVGTFIGGLLPGMFANRIMQSLDNPAPYRFSLWVGAVIAAVALVPLSRIKRTAAPTSTTHTGKPSSSAPILPIVLMAVYVYIRHAGWASCQSFCNAYMDTDLQLSTSSIGLITSVVQVAAIVASLLTPRVMARYNNGGTLLLTTVGVAVSLLPMGLIPHWAAAGIGRIGYQVASAMWIPVLQVFQMELVDSEWRSLTYGITSMAMGFGFGSLSLAGGYIITEFGYRSVFLVGAGLELVAAAVLWGVLRKQKRT
ncbi:MAG: MFS transporter [Anaerolineae bacterium]